MLSQPRVREATGADAPAPVGLWRAAGLGSVILAELERRLLAKGCRRVNPLVEPDNAGVTAFSDRHGYPADELIFLETWFTG